MSDEVLATKKAKPLNSKAISKITASIESMTDPLDARKKRKKLAERILRQIAAGEIRNPVAAAKAYTRALDKTDAPTKSLTGSAT